MFFHEDMSCLTRSGDLTVLGRAVAAIPVQPNVRDTEGAKGKTRMGKMDKCNG